MAQPFLTPKRSYKETILNFDHMNRVNKLNELRIYNF